MPKSGADKEKRGQTHFLSSKTKVLKQMSNSGELETLVNEAIEANPDQVEQYRTGKTKVMGFFVGQINQLLKAKLDG